MLTVSCPVAGAMSLCWLKVTSAVGASAHPSLFRYCHEVTMPHCIGTTPLCQIARLSMTLAALLGERSDAADDKSHETLKWTP